MTSLYEVVLDKSSCLLNESVIPETRGLQTLPLPKKEEPQKEVLTGILEELDEPHHEDDSSMPPLVEEPTPEQPEELVFEDDEVDLAASTAGILDDEDDL